MTRVVYIAGKYRHYLPNGAYDLPKMAAEVLAEQRWSRIVAECDMMWIAPLSNSVHLEVNPPISGNEFVQRDLALLQRMRPGFDIVLMRAGWDEGRVSEGAETELSEAEECGLIVAHTTHGEAAVREYLTSLNS